MHLTVAITLDNNMVVSARGEIDSLNVGYVAYIAALVSQATAEEAVAVLAEGE